MSQLTPIIDSRKAINPEKSLFFAIKGERNNGHDFISQLYEKGVRNFVIEDPNFNTLTYKNASFQFVKSSILALQKYVQKKRSTFSIPIIGITGSNGKTIVKEWLSELLQDEEIIVKNPRSYNSQVGVPLSVWEIQPYHSLGIFEAGISQIGEMEKLEKVTQPNIGIFTNIGSSHDEGFENRKQKIKEKLKLFTNSKLLIYHKEEDLLNSIVEESQLATLSWSFSQVADVTFQVSNHTLLLKSSHFKISNAIFDIHDSNHGSVENLCHCITYLLYKKYPIKTIQQRVHKLQAIAMRLEVKKGIHNCQLIDDTYNIDLVGLQTALDFLIQQSQKNTHTIILSDIYQTGLAKRDLYEQIDSLLKVRNIDRLIGIGDISNFEELFHCKKSFYTSTDEFLKSNEIFENEAILIKGARSFQFEKIVKKLSAQQHSTVLEINLNALEHNFNYYKSLLKPITKIMVMVKAHAYGSGSDEIAKVLQYNHVDYLAVAYADEGVELRKKDISVPMMVMNPSEQDFNNLSQFNLEPEIYSMKLLTKWVDFSQNKNNIPKIHIKIDTGMHRLGFEEADIQELTTIILKNNIQIGSAFTHLVGADEAIHNTFSIAQLNHFEELATKLELLTQQKFIKHALNSSGIISFPDKQFDMVRLGIGLYGFNPIGKDVNIESVVSLYSSISQIKNVKKGDTIGYGRVGKAEMDVKIATISIGYADGISRQLANGVGSVIINGAKAPIVGNVCMDMLMVNVTLIDCKEGDRVEIFGNQISINEIAQSTNTIPYEILTSVSQRVKRVYFRD